MTPGDLEYFSWSGYRPDGTCPQCGEEWTDVMFAYDGPHCSIKRPAIMSSCGGAGSPMFKQSQYPVHSVTDDIHSLSPKEK